MGSQIIFFQKNKADYEYSQVEVVASEGQESAYLPFNRDNFSAWITEGSSDASDTTYELNFNDVRRLTDILLIKMNWKEYSIQYWDDDEEQWSDFSTPIDVDNHASEHAHHHFDLVNTSKILITIYGTQVPDEEKYLFQLIATERIGQFEGWPVIKNPKLGRDVKASAMLSGKNQLLESVGAYSVRLSFTHIKNNADLSLIEHLYSQSEGFLFWPSGGDESQFSSVREGYRFEDIYLVRCSTDYKPEWIKGVYVLGMKLDIDLIETVT